MYNFLNDINWNPIHYIQSDEYWIKNSDSYISQMPGMAIGAPINWIISNLIILYLIRIWLPKYMSNRESFDCKPWMLCLDGLIFGGYITALSCGAFVTHLYSDCFDCSSYSAETNDAKILGLKHLAYSAVFAKYGDFIIPIFMILRKKYEPTTWHLLHLSIWSIGAVLLAKINPGGIFTLVTLLDGLYSSTLYIYLTFSAAGGEFKPSNKAKSILFFTRMATLGLTLAHSAYYLSIPNCGSPLIKFLLASYSLCALIMFPYDWYTTEKERKQMYKTKYSIFRETRFGSLAYNKLL